MKSVYGVNLILLETILPSGIIFFHIVRRGIAVKFCECITKTVFGIITNHFCDFLYFIFRGLDKFYSFLHPTNIIKCGEQGAHKPYCQSYIECSNLPLYSFGHGLSYSNFVYEELTLSKTKMTKDEEIEVKITIHNSSDIAGKETVMLYMQDIVASTARHVQQLIGFKKVSFGVNERKTISFTVTEPMLRFWNNENKFESEPGEFKFSTGYADHLILTEKFNLL